MTFAAKTLTFADTGYGRLVIPVHDFVASSTAAALFEIPLFSAPDFVSDAGNGNDVIEYGRLVLFTVKAVYVTGDAAMTGATATATTLALTRYNAAGTGGVTVASTAFITGTNLVAFSRFSLGAITAANAGLQAGFTLTLKKTVASTGTATPNLLVTVVLA